MLLDLQHRFRAAVLAEGDGALPGLIAGDRAMARERIAIYRNNVQSSLIEALARAFPVTRRIVGAEFFAGMAKAFIAVSPPTVPQLSAYGADFPTFVAVFDSECRLPYLPDVARLEWARIEAHFSAEAPTLDIHAAAAAGDSIAARGLVPHPATRWLRSAFPIVTIWEVNQPEVIDVPALDLSAAENALITRAGMNLGMRRLGAADVVLIESLAKGMALGDAAADALAADSRFDLQAALAAHFAAGSFSALAEN